MVIAFLHALVSKQQQNTNSILSRWTKPGMSPSELKDQIQEVGCAKVGIKQFATQDLLSR
jgi:hypothetical protein